jgi:hypothetical protein
VDPGEKEAILEAGGPARQESGVSVIVHCGAVVHL